MKSLVTFITMGFFLSIGSFSAFAQPNTSGGGDVFTIQEILPVYDLTVNQITQHGSEFYSGDDWFRVKKLIEDKPRIVADPMEDDLTMAARAKVHHTYGFYTDNLLYGNEQSTHEWLVVNAPAYNRALTTAAKMSLINFGLCQLAEIKTCGSVKNAFENSLIGIQVNVQTLTETGPQLIFPATQIGLDEALKKTIASMSFASPVLYSLADVEKIGKVLKVIRANQYHVSWTTPAGNWGMYINLIMDQKAFFKSADKRALTLFNLTRTAFSDFERANDGSEYIYFFFNSDDWKLATHPFYLQALLHHEIMVMAGIEHTGDYAFTQRYLAWLIRSLSQK